MLQLELRIEKCLSKYAKRGGRTLLILIFILLLCGFPFLPFQCSGRDDIHLMCSASNLRQCYLLSGLLINTRSMPIRWIARAACISCDIVCPCGCHLLNGVQELSAFNVALSTHMVAAHQLQCRSQLHLMRFLEFIPRRVVRSLCRGTYVVD